MQSKGTVARKSDFTCISNAVLRDAKLSMRAKLAYTVLKSYDFHGEGCRISRKTLAREMGCSVRTADRALDELCEAELIERRRRGLTLTNEYLLATPEIAEVATPESPDSTHEEDSLEEDKISTTTTTTRVRETTGSGVKNEQPSSTGESDDLAAQILDRFNEYANTEFEIRDWRRMIGKRMRRHPEFGLDEWIAVINRAFAERWWERRERLCGAVTPAVVFKSDRLVASFLNIPADEIEEAEWVRSRSLVLVRDDGTAYIIDDEF